MGFPACVIRRNVQITALSAIAAAPDRPAFPTIVDCPICRQNTLHLFDDLFTDGIWLHCAGCAAHGDIITFGSALWNISLPETLVKFSDLAVLTPDEAETLIGVYGKFYPRQAAAEAFILDTKTQVWNHGDDTIACILRNLGLYHEIPACTGLIGVAHYEQVAKVCATLGRSKPTRLREDGAFIVFPFYDLPGRLTGFLLLQYNDRSESSQTFVPISAYKRKKPEAGYFLLDTILTPPPPQFKTNQFVSDDILWVLKAQCVHLKHRFKLLPLMASYTGREANSFGLSWRALPNAQRIFTGFAYTPELISRAEAAKGYAAAAPSDALPERITGPSEPLNRVFARLSRAWRQAKTWQTALHEAINGQTELTAASFCERLTVPHDKLNKFLTGHAHNFSDGFNDRVLNAVKTTLAAPIRAQRRWIIIERDSGWWTQAGLQICNAKPTIKKVIQADNGERIYSGDVLIDGQIFEFFDSASVIESLGLLRYLGKRLGPEGKFVVYDNAWNRRSHLLAMQLHPPELVTVSSKTGWDSNAEVFRFAKYELDRRGEFKATPQIPGLSATDIFPEPNDVPPIQIREFLTPSNENAFIWATAAAIIGNFIAVITGKDCVATALTPEAFNVAVRVGAAFNCRLTQLTNIRKNTIGGALDAALAQHNWPAFVLNLFHDTAFSRVIPQYHLKPLFVRTNTACAASAVGYGWQTITPTTNCFTKDCSVLKYVLPSYIQKTLKTRLQKFAGYDSIAQTVLTDLGEWLPQTYGSTFNTAFAQTLLKTPSDADTVLRAELQTAIAQDRIAVLPQPRKRAQAANYFIRQTNKWWLNRRAIDSHFHAERSTPVNWFSFVDLLANRNLLIDEEVVHGMPGIWVNAAWGDELLQKPHASEFQQELG